MPRENFDRFGLGEKSKSPISYSLQYIIEGEMNGGQLAQTNYIDLIAHYNSFEVHFIQDLTDINNSWVVVTEELETMAMTPRK